jgi:imidazolonepropionase-like amidohydrolase
MRYERPAFVMGIVLLLAACGKADTFPLVERTAPPSAILISNVSVLDVDRGIAIPGQDVFIEGASIVAVAATGSRPPPPNATVIDGDGATVMPGLIDMHAHLGNGSAPSWLGRLPDPKANMLAYLYCGVTTVLEPGDQAPDAFKRRAGVASGEMLGPRIFTAGPFITADGGHPVPIIRTLAPWWIRWYLIGHRTRQVKNPDEARAAVKELAQMRADFVKVMVDRIPEQVPRITNELVAAAVVEARGAGLRTLAHIGSAQDAMDAANAGVAMWMHGVYKEKLSPEQVAALAKFGIPMVPTIGVFENYALLGQGPRVPTALEKETASAEVLGAFDNPPQTKATAYFGPYIQSLRPLRPAWRENVRALRQAGVMILAGSDTQSGVFPGAGLHRELNLLVESGMTPVEAIRAATSDAARFLANGAEPAFGLVAPGKAADLLIVDGDPTRSLEALSRIRAVIQAGTPLRRTSLLAGASASR